MQAPLLLALSAPTLSALKAMFSLHSFFPTLPSEEGIERRRQHLQHADAKAFCCKLVSQIMTEPTIGHCMVHFVKQPSGSSKHKLAHAK